MLYDKLYILSALSLIGCGALLLIAGLLLGFLAGAAVGANVEARKFKGYVKPQPRVRGRFARQIIEGIE